MKAPALDQALMSHHILPRNAKKKNCQCDKIQGFRLWRFSGSASLPSNKHQKCVFKIFYLTVIFFPCASDLLIQKTKTLYDLLLFSFF